jgi:pimeloyl-ACP methyl ester carboxylesterase
VIAPANPLRGLTSDAAYMRSVLRTMDGPIVVVGHSHGGAVITNAAVGVPQVKALVYLAGFAPDQGDRSCNS